MNPRIQELAKCNERIENFFLTGPVQRAAIEDFAELIIRECAQVADVADKNGCEWIGGNILTHFGITQ